MLVLSRAEAGLGQCVEPMEAQGVDQDRDLDAISDGERDRLEQGPASGELARERLGEPGQAAVRGG